MDFVAIDFEIANAKWASACQISLVKVSAGQVSSTWVSYISPQVEYQDLGNIQYGKHKITKETYLTAPNLKQLWPEIQAFVGDLPVVAHNAQFDIGVMNQSLESWGLPSSNFQTICSQKLAKALLPEPPHTLKALTQKFEIPLLNHHDAKSDAIACAKLTLALAEMASLPSTSDLLKIAGYKNNTNSRNSYRSSSLERDIGKTDARNDEILEFLSTPPNLFEVTERPFEDMDVSVLRLLFGLDLDTTIAWISALGGNYVDYFSVDDCDLVLLGNIAKQDSQEKLADITAITKVLKEDKNRLSAEEFFDLAFSATQRF